MESVCMYTYNVDIYKHHVPCTYSSASWNTTVDAMLEDICHGKCMRAYM
jgi:hypothetical protein